MSVNRPNHGRQVNDTSRVMNENFNCNRAAEDLITKANNAATQEERTKLMTEAGKMVMEDYPIIPLLQYTTPRLVKTYVGGYFTENALDRIRSRDLYILKH